MGTARLRARRGLVKEEGAWSSLGETVRGEAGKGSGRGREPSACFKLDSVYTEEDELNSSSIFPVCKHQSVNTSLNDSDIFQKLSQT